MVDPSMAKADLIAMKSSLRAKMNTRGDKGSPCIVDLFMLNFSEMNPLFEIQLLRPLNNILIQEQKFSLKLYNLKTL